VSDEIISKKARVNTCYLTGTIVPVKKGLTKHKTLQVGSSRCIGITLSLDLLTFFLALLSFSAENMKLYSKLVFVTFALTAVSSVAGYSSSGGSSNGSSSGGSSSESGSSKGSKSGGSSSGGSSSGKGSSKGSKSGGSSSGGSSSGGSSGSHPSRRMTLRA
jgi:hypothetical protein